MAATNRLMIGGSQQIASPHDVGVGGLFYGTYQDNASPSVAQKQLLLARYQGANKVWPAKSYTTEFVFQVTPDTSMNYNISNMYFGLLQGDTYNITKQGGQVVYWPGYLTIDWGDGTIDTDIEVVGSNGGMYYDSTLQYYRSGWPDHTYTTPGIYTLTIKATSEITNINFMGQHNNWLGGGGGPADGNAAVPKQIISGVIKLQSSTIDNLTNLFKINGSFASTKVSGANLFMNSDYTPNPTFSIDMPRCTSFNSTFWVSYLTTLPGTFFQGCAPTGLIAMYGTFHGSQLTTIPQGLFTGIHAGLFYDTFSGCTKLGMNGVSDIPADLFTSKLPIIGDRGDKIFANCTSLTNIPVGLFGSSSNPLPIVDKNGVGWIGHMAFWGCTALTNSNGGLSGIFDNILTNASAVNAINLGGVFAGCSSLTEDVNVIFPQTSYLSVRNLGPIGTGTNIPNQSTAYGPGFRWYYDGIGEAVPLFGPYNYALSATVYGTGASAAVTGSVATFATKFPNVDSVNNAGNVGATVNGVASTWCFYGCAGVNQTGLTTQQFTDWVGQ